MPPRRAASGPRVSATDAAKNFGHLVDRVREEGVSYVIERGGTPVARISPIEREVLTMAGFKALARGLAGAPEDYVAAVERAAARHNRPRVRRNPWAR